MGYRGLDLGNLGSEKDHSSASVVIQISWSESSAHPTSSLQVLLNVGLRLQNWLHELGAGVVGVMRFENALGESFELRIEN